MGVRRAIELNPDVEGFILCNDDCLLESPGGFTLLYEAWKENPQYGIIGAVTDLTGQPLQHRRDIGLRAVPHIAFVCCFVPRSTFENVQAMDEAYCIDYGVDDRDLCEAVNRAGLNVGVHDGCFVNHSSLVSSFRGDPKTPRSFQKNYAYFKSKWGILE
jgi:GT2 family glycosyltransferase